MTQVLVILGGFSEIRFFGTFKILQMSDLGGLTLVPYGLPGPNGDTKLLIWPLPLIYVAFDRPYPGVQYNQKLRWRKS